MRAKHPQKKYLLILIAVCTLIVLFYGIVLVLFLKNTLEFTSRGRTLQENFKSEQSNYIPIITTVFDKAEMTNVRQDIDTYASLFSVGSDGRKPVYFIRLKNGKLQKLFQSGEIKYEAIDTSGEKIVAEMLKGEINPIAFPQYTCCGGNDIWSRVFPLNVLLPERTYLKDFPSELETILLIKDKNGIIKGAMVDLHGD